ncbi:hypothetical protein [Pseudonocardia sp. T1-2H]|uniref:hypothetical protein n=1 Tax=Pseudonocardia sp. T1-2H TaxID=3128899 RepID=UPI003101288A
MSVSPALPEITERHQLDALPVGTVIRPLNCGPLVLSFGDTPLDLVAYRSGANVDPWTVTGRADGCSSSLLFRLATRWTLVTPLPGAPANPPPAPAIPLPDDDGDRALVEFCLRRLGERAHTQPAYAANLIVQLLSGDLLRSIGGDPGHDVELDPALLIDGDWRTCELHGGAITQDCDCTSTVGLGDVLAAQKVLEDRLVGLTAGPGGYGSAMVGRARGNAVRAIVAAYHGVEKG